MSAIELFKEDGTTAGIFYCSECKVVARTKEEADFCHASQWIGDELEPDDVFSAERLEAWAENNGYKLEV